MRSNSARLPPLGAQAPPLAVGSGWGWCRGGKCLKAWPHKTPPTRAALVSWIPGSPGPVLATWSLDSCPHPQIPNPWLPSHRILVRAPGPQTPIPTPPHPALFPDPLPGTLQPPEHQTSSPRPPFMLPDPRVPALTRAMCRLGLWLLGTLWLQGECGASQARGGGAPVPRLAFKGELGRPVPGAPSPAGRGTEEPCPGAERSCLAT